MAPSTSKPLSARWFWLIWLTSLALFLGSCFFIWKFGPFAARPTAFRQTAHGWDVLPPIPAVGYDLRISDGGVAWLQTANGLMRLEGSRWHRFSASDYGTEHDYLPGHFTLDGEDVWAAATDAVIHFDGQRWQRYPNAVATEEASSIAAAHGQVWAIDREGNLSHFDGRAWTIRKLDLPGVRWDSGSFSEPLLGSLADGTLFLVYQGLWRADGVSWTRIPGVSSKVALLGVSPPATWVYEGKRIDAAGDLWVLDGREVAGFEADGKRAAHYTFHDLGLLDSTTVYSVAARPPVLAVGTSQGVVWWDGSQWHGDQPSAAGVYMASSVAVAPDGSLWGVGYPPRRTHFSSLRYVGIANAILSLFALLFPIWWWSRKQRRRRQDAREAVLHATGALPEDADEPAAWKSSGFLVVLAMGGAAYGAVKHYWPATPTWALPFFLVAAHVAGSVVGSLKKRKPRPSDPIGPGGPPRYDWAKSLPAILGSLAGVLLLYGGSIARHFHIRWLAAFPGFAFLFVGGLAWTAYEIFRGQRVEAEIKRCHYGKALEMLDGPLGWPSNALSKLLRADALFYWGRAREAEAIVRELVDAKNDANHKTLALEHLGRNLIAQSRYEDARRAFEAAVGLMPARSAAYTGLAEVRLLQDREPVQALDYAERALELHRKSLLEKKSAKERLAIIRGNQAWALARMGRAAEAHQAIEAGTREMDLKYTPEVAGFYWRAGMAMLAIENVTAAAGHFRRGAELDPQGYYGKLAAEHLSRHSVWGAVGIA